MRISRSWRCAARSGLPADTNSAQVYFQVAEKSDSCEVKCTPKRKSTALQNTSSPTGSHAEYCGSAECTADNDLGKHVRACAHTYVPLF